MKQKERKKKERKKKENLLVGMNQQDVLIFSASIKGLLTNEKV